VSEFMRGLHSVYPRKKSEECFTHEDSTSVQLGVGCIEASECGRDAVLFGRLLTLHPHMQSSKPGGKGENRETG